MITPAQAAPDTLTLYDYLPDFVQANDEAGGYQFLSWLDGFISMGSSQPSLTYTWSYNTDGSFSLLEVPYTESNNPIPEAIGLQAIDNIIRDTPYQPGWSVLLDVSQCPTYALPWLAQFRGVRFSQPGADAAMRKAIQLACPFDRGTAAYITYHANLQMTPSWLTSGNPGVTLEERTSMATGVPTYDPYAVTVAFPLAGVGSYTYGELFARYSTYAALEGGFTSYGAMTGNEADLESEILSIMPAGLFVYFAPY